MDRMLQSFGFENNSNSTSRYSNAFDSFVKTAEKRNSDNKDKSKIKYLIIASLVLAIVLIFCFAKTLMDQNSQRGAYAGLTQDQKIALLNEQAAAGMINVSVASDIVFNEGTLNPGTARLVNESTNHLSQKYTLTLENSDEILYESGIVEPGFWIEQITLNKELAPGKYNANITVTAFNQESHEEVGSCVAQVSLTVKDKTNVGIAEGGGGSH